jgi:hypothetical protein
MPCRIDSCGKGEKVRPNYPALLLAMVGEMPLCRTAIQNCLLGLFAGQFAIAAAPISQRQNTFLPTETLYCANGPPFASHAKLVGPPNVLRNYACPFCVSWPFIVQRFWARYTAVYLTIAKQAFHEA